MEPRIKDPPQARGVPEHGLLRNIREGFLEEVSQELREMSKSQLGVEGDPGWGRLWSVWMVVR